LYDIGTFYVSFAYESHVSWNKTEKTSTSIYGEPAPSALRVRLGIRHDRGTAIRSAKARIGGVWQWVYYSKWDPNGRPSLISWDDKKTPRVVPGKPIMKIRSQSFRPWNTICIEMLSLKDRCEMLSPPYISRPNPTGQSSGNDTDAWFSLFRILTNIKKSEHIRHREV